MIVAMTSKLLAGKNGRGEMTEVTPRIKKILNIFDPTTFPIAMSAFFLKAAAIEVANSGSEVPTATTVSPMTD